MQFSKTNTLIGKIAIIVLALVLMFALCLPQSIALNNTEATVSNRFEIKGFKTTTEYKVGDTISWTNSNNVVIEVKDPKNSVVNLNGSSELALNMAGTYAFTFKKNDGTTGTLRVNVKGEKNTLNFDLNSEKIIPATINKNTKVVFPNPQVLDENGDVVESALATITLKKSGVATPQVLVVDGDDKSFTFAEAGVYELSYEYNSNGNKVKKSFNIDVIDGFENNVDLIISTKSSIPTTLTQGVEVTLPKAIGKDANNNNAEVSVYTTILVEHVGTTTTEMEVKDYKFTPTLAGTYRITYTIKDFYGNEKSESYDLIQNVKDTVAPTIKFVDNYAVEEDGSVLDATVELLKEIKDTIPTKVGTGYELTIPAIFASDNVAAYKDITMKRYIKKAGSVAINLDDIDGNKKNEKIVNYALTEAGTYTLYFEASDSKNTTSQSLYKFDIVVEDGFTDNVAPKITINEFIKDENGVTIQSVKPGQRIKVAKPTAIDFVDPTDPTNQNINAKNVKVEVTVRETGVVNASVCTLELDEDKQFYVFKDGESIPSSVSGEIEVVYTATDDFGNTNEVVRKVKVVDTNDEEVPTINIGDISSLPEATQGDVYDFFFENPIKVEDDDTNVLVKAIVMCDGDVVDVTSELERNANKSSYKMSFIPFKAGTYLISFVAIDAGGNIVVDVATVTAISDAKPTVKVMQEKTTYEIGEIVEAPIAKAYLDGVLREDAEIKVVQTGNFNEVGTVTLKYTATVDGKVSEQEEIVTIKIQDTTAPVITLDNEMDLIYDLVKSGDTYEAITVTGFTATDNGTGVNLDSMKVVVKDSSGNEIIKKEATGEEFTFVPKGDGKYTITWSVKDAQDNEATITRTISVGDVVKPVIDVQNSDEISAAGKLKDGKYVLTLDTSKVVINDEGQEEALDNDDYLSVKVLDSSGNEVTADSEGENVYTLTTAGNYTIKYVATDKAGNTQTWTKKLVISSEENSGATVTEVLGTILLIVSIIILLGVIWYFVKPAPKSKKQAKKTEEENK